MTAQELPKSITLDDGQRAAVMSGIDKALLVVAGPGSGKTRVIVERVKHLISDLGIKPSEILCLTFSDKAASEMRTRIEKEADTVHVETCTFHSFCLGILEESGFDTGVNFKGGVISKASQMVWGLKNIDSFGLEHVEVGNNAERVINAFLEGISAFRDELVNPQELKDYIDKKKPECEALLASAEGDSPSGKRKGARKANGQEDLQDKIAFLNKLSDLQKVYEKYEQYKRKESLIDYDDMIHIVIDTFRDKPEVLRKYQGRYAYVLVDEFQDNNYAQLELVTMLCPEGNITVVGDDDQSIYRFRGAFDGIFADFQDKYKDHSLVKLERNYRSTKNIVALAKNLLDPVPGRVKKNLYSENEKGDRAVVARCSTDAAEIQYVVAKIKELVGQDFVRRDGTQAKLGYGDIAILSRKRADGIKFANGLKAGGIPCTFVGESRIFSTPIVRDTLAYLQVAADPLDSGVDIARILFIHGAPEQDVKIVNHAARTKRHELVKRLDKDNHGSRSEDRNRNYGTDFVYQVLEEIASGNELAGQLKAKALVVDIYNQMKTILALREQTTLGQFVHEVLMKHTDIYKRTLNGSGDSDRDRLVLHEFLEIVRQFEAVSPHASLHDLLAHIDMMSDFDIELKNEKKGGDSVTVTTIHQSKGREFPVVFIVDVAERRLPARFQEKQFYCPSEIAHGVRNRDKDEREVSLEEERRILYVGMTRAQHKLFLTLAEIYGGNTSKTKGSQFLQELDVENNPLVRLETFDSDGHVPLTLAISEDRAEQLKQECQTMATKYISQMQIKSAIEKIAELALVEHLRAGKPIDTFDASEIVPGIAVDKAKIEALLNGNGAKERLVDGEKIHFSASALKTYKDCPLQYKFKYVLEVPSGGKSFFDLGSAVHSVVEVLTKRQIEEQGYLPTKEDALKVLDHYWVSSSYRSLMAEKEDRAHAERMLEFFVNWCAERKAAQCMPVAAEQEFEIKLAGKKVIGYIDRIDKTPSGDYEVFDYKTGKSMLTGNTIRKDIQMNLYSLAIEDLYGKLPASANLLYVRKEKKLSYDADGESVQQSKADMVSLIEGILDENFNALPDYNTCRFCDYQSICEAKEVEHN